MKFWMVCLWLLIVGLGSSAAQAHEMEADRLTLVRRHPQQVSLRFHMDLVSLMHRSLAPQLSDAEFLVQTAALDAAAFRTQFERLQLRIQSSTQLAPAQGAWQAPTQWQWPTPSRVQTLIQQRAMQSVVAPHDHAHGQTLEVSAEWLSKAPTAAVQLRLPPELPRVLVVHYEPQQRWVRSAPAEKPPLFRF
ncbi:hypothetical protein [Inhella gelatinilytica]|uniref:DUF4390 domain-containing protein n=1 Tax=Inhella gelatinilytica TaxID=2795030 RepID=A0A931IX98_9BURK|nr:hypothetical protein [Inhella gelatinilytica]MBH9553854.1 hypothetical protein [Inhella gelatinilytica]